MPQAKKKTDPKDVDAYIAAAPEGVRPMLKELRKTIRSAAPNAVEKISYGMPTYEQHGRIAYFAGYKSHVGLYAVAHAGSTGDPEVARYLENQSTLRFPVGQELPVAMIRKLVEARVRENESQSR